MFFILYLIRLPIKLFQKIIQILKSSTLLSPFFKLARILFKTSVYLTLATIIYAYYYITSIPDVTQCIPLQTIRQKEGYHARVITTGHTVPICEFSNLLDPTRNISDEHRAKYCKLSHDKSEDTLKLEGELYNYALVVEMPNSEHNLKVGGVVASVEFLDPNLNVYDAHGYSVFSKRRGLIGWIFYLAEKILSYEGTLTVEVPIRENFNNKIFQVAVIDILIESPALMINQVTLRVTTELKGYKYYMHHWFLTCAFFSIFWIIILLKMAIGLITEILVKLKITSRKAIKIFTDGTKKRLKKGFGIIKTKITKLIDAFDPIGSIFDRITEFYLSRIFPIY